MICGVVLFIVLGSAPIVWSQEPGLATEEVLTVEQAVPRIHAESAGRECRVRGGKSR